MKLPTNNKGTAIVEFAIILPLLLALLFGIIEFGILLYDKAMITNASREGARAGIVFNSPGGSYSPLPYDQVNPPGIKQIVDAYLTNHIVTFSSDNNWTTTVTASDGGTQCPNPSVAGIRQITVTVDYPYTFLVLPNLVTSLVGLNPLNLQAVTVMRCE